MERTGPPPSELLSAGRCTNGAAGKDTEMRQTLHILRIASDVYPDVTGGGAIHAHAMSRQQAARGHSVTVLTSDHGDSDRPAVERTDGYTIVRHQELVRPFGNSITPSIVASLRDHLADADVVHAHSHLYFTSNVAAVMGQVSETPLVVTNHGLMSQTAPKWLQRLFIPTVAQFTFNAADRVLCYTETDRRRLRERDVDTPVEVIENGIDCEQFTPVPTNERPQRLLFVGRLTDIKGVPTLLEGFARLSDQYPELELRIVGDGPQRTAYEQQCRDLGIDDRVTFVGTVPYDEVASHYQECQALVLPSRNEGMPRTVLEAMACETPVVTTALPQLESTVEGAGDTIAAGSVADLVESVSRLLDDEALRRRLGRTARQRVVAENSWAKTVERTTDVYYDLL